MLIPVTSRSGGGRAAWCLQISKVLWMWDAQVPMVMARDFLRKGDV